MSSRTQKILVTFALGLVILLAGCAQLSVHATVTADGTIEEYRVQINTTRAVYGLLDQSAEEDGYSSVRDSILSDIDETRAETIDYNEEFDGDTVTMTITMTGFDPGDDGDISVRVDGDTLVYEDLTFVNETTQTDPTSERGTSMMSVVSVDYYLTMPGEIIDSNADVVDGNTAEWHESGSDAFDSNPIYAESDLPSTTQLPGFGVVVALAGLAFLVGIGALVSRRNT